MYVNIQMKDDGCSRNKKQYCDIVKNTIFRIEQSCHSRFEYFL